MFDPDQLPVPDLGLACKECGYPLAGLREHRCPECGTAFSLDEFIPRGDCPPLIADGREIRATQQVVELLRLYQVPFIQLGDSGAVFLGSARVLSNAKTPPRIGVPRDQYLFVVDLIRRDRHNEPMPEPPSAALRTEPWVCGHCGESNPPNFEICWQCGEASPHAGA